ncbi:MAG: ribonuclease D [Alphaproteobacteria bacterium]|nr:ribonuclease D [Alphaproteobacteria bacterium]
MQVISDSASLAGFCQRLAEADYVTVDTEFMRVRTYWPQLCLVQLAGPDDAAVVDALAEGLDLAPLLGLMADPKVLKVFHAARQDIEIFYRLSGAVPAPLFDTQIAAMVCGFGDAVGYETLVAKLAKARIDKSMRFTDWSHRPLSDKQLDYALSDVTHLRTAYDKLSRRIERTGRSGWLDEEMGGLTAPETYAQDPKEAWRRLKTKSSSPRFYAVLREVTAWRESEAQSRDVPRNRVLRDDILLDIAAHGPQSEEELTRTRGLARNSRSPQTREGILAAVARGLAVPDDQCPLPPRIKPLPRGLKPVVDLLKVLLQAKCEEFDVARKLVANSNDLEQIAADDAAEVPALSGWRRQVFGDDALALKHGKLALAIDGKALNLVAFDAPRGREDPGAREDEDAESAAAKTAPV